MFYFLIEKQFVLFLNESVNFLLTAALLEVVDNQFKIGQSTMNSFVVSLMDYSSDLMKKINVPTLSICENHCP